MVARKMAAVFGLALLLVCGVGACSNKSDEEKNAHDKSATDGSAPVISDDGEVKDASKDSATDGSAPAISDDGEVKDASKDSATDGAAPATSCTRDKLLQIIEDYFTAMAAHDPSSLPVAKAVKFTENGSELQLGDGVWKTAGELKFHRDIIDTEQCGTLTEAVIDEGDSMDIFALRLKLENLQITEVETVVVRGDGADQIWYNNGGPQAIIDAKHPEWDEVVPEDQRSTREELAGLAEQYFKLFVDGDVSQYPFSSDCSRYEDGLLTTAGGGCPAFIAAANADEGTPRYPVIDVERGQTSGIMLIMSVVAFYDIHMFKVVDGKVTRIHAVMSSQNDKTTGWD